MWMYGYVRVPWVSLEYKAPLLFLVLTTRGLSLTTCLKEVCWTLLSSTEEGCGNDTLHHTGHKTTVNLKQENYWEN